MNDYQTRLQAIGLTLLTPFTKAKDKHTLKCNTCEHVWQATPISKLQNFKKYHTNGCPNCNTKSREAVKADKRRNAIDKIVEKGFEILSTYDGQQTTAIKIKVKRVECGHVFESAPGNLLHRDVTCPICNTIRKRDAFKFYNNVRQQKFHTTASEWEAYRNAVYQITEQVYAQNVSLINPNNYKRGIAGQPDCYHLDHIISVRRCFELNVPPEICGHITNLQMLSWQDNISKRDKMSYDFIPQPLKKYVEQDSVARLISQLSVELEANNVTYQIHSDVLKPYRVHMYLPDKKIAVRFYDVDECSEQKINSTAVQKNVLTVAQRKQIRLIQIFSDEVRDSYEIVYAKLAFVFGIRTDVQRIFARQCTIAQIASPIKNDFLKAYHIQGEDKSPVCLGAFYKEKLIAVMTFCPPRVTLGRQKEEGLWELCRFTTDYNYHIPGIASKLLKFFERNYSPKMIYSYADARWSVGNLYHRLGFVMHKHNKPSYWYVVNGQRKHRWAYRKDAIRERYPDVYDSQKTEYEMMLQLGLDRVWDAGTLLFIKSVDCDEKPL